MEVITRLKHVLNGLMRADAGHIPQSDISSKPYLLLLGFVATA